MPGKDLDIEHRLAEARVALTHNADGSYDVVVKLDGGYLNRDDAAHMAEYWASELREAYGVSDESIR